ncbi:MAG: hypothetical protein L0211_00085 [Planctomycetaceae bacterium]|nr:hypothetical protein [Planctomycetaceae bacterium]
MPIPSRAIATSVPAHPWAWILSAFASGFPSSQGGGFGQQPGYGAGGGVNPYSNPPGVGAPPPRKSNTWLWILGIVGVLGIGTLICCGVGGYALFSVGMGAVTQELKNQVAGDPNVERHLGEIKNLSIDVMATGTETEKRGRGAQVLVFNAQGSEGKEAKFIVEQSRNPQPGDMFSKIDLRLPSGEEISIK